MLSDLEKIEVLTKYIRFYTVLLSGEKPTDDSESKSKSLDYVLHLYKFRHLENENEQRFTSNQAEYQNGHDLMMKNLKELKEYALHDNRLKRVDNSLSFLNDSNNENLSDFDKIKGVERIMGYAATYSNFRGDADMASGSLTKVYKIQQILYYSQFMKDINSIINHAKEVANHYNIDIREEKNIIDDTIFEILSFPKYAKLQDELEVYFRCYNNIMNEVGLLKKMNNINEIGNSLLILKTLNEELLESFNNPEASVNDPKFNESFYQSMSNYGMFEKYNTLRKSVNDIKMKIINNDDYKISGSQAFRYYKSNKTQSSNISSFVKQKKMDENILFTNDLKNHPHYKSLIVFSDESLLLKNKKDELILINDNYEACTIIQSVFEQIIDSKLNKNPHVAKKFKNSVNIKPHNMHGAYVALETFINNESILKSNKFDIIDAFSMYSRFEKMDDKMNEIILNHKIKKYADSIVSNKYKNLYNDNSYDICKELYNLKVDANILQDIIGKKLASFKTPEDFNNSLSMLLNSFSAFTMENLTTKANNNNIRIVSNDDDLLILQIKDFEQSKTIGSASWCISRHEHYFKSYTEKGQTQYFIFDFKKSNKDNESMIGVTLNKDGSYNTSHLKNDEHYGKYKVSSLQLKILEKDLDSYPKLSAELKKELKTKQKMKTLNNF